MHRSDDSGATYTWTDYLSKVSSEWKSRVGQGTSVAWPVGQAATGDEGVSQKIREVRGAIGYVELSCAQKTKFPFGSVKNSDGRFIAAGLGGIRNAASAVGTRSLGSGSRSNVYPIASLTWILVPLRARKAATKKALKEFLAWIVTDGQQYAADVYCSPLPAEVAAEAPSKLGEHH